MTTSTVDVLPGPGTVCRQGDVSIWIGEDVAEDLAGRLLDAVTSGAGDTDVLGAVRALLADVPEGALGSLAVVAVSPNGTTGLLHGAAVVQNRRGDAQSGALTSDVLTVDVAPDGVVALWGSAGPSAAAPGAGRYDLQAGIVRGGGVVIRTASAGAVPSGPGGPGGDLAGLAGAGLAGAELAGAELAGAGPAGAGLAAPASDPDATPGPAPAAAPDGVPEPPLVAQPGGFEMPAPLPDPPRFEAPAPLPDPPTRFEAPAPLPDPPARFEAPAPLPDPPHFEAPAPLPDPPTRFDAPAPLPDPPGSQDAVPPVAAGGDALPAPAADAGAGAVEPPGFAPPAASAPPVAAPQAPVPPVEPPPAAPAPPPGFLPPAFSPPAFTPPPSALIPEPDPSGELDAPTPQPGAMRPGPNGAPQPVPPVAPPAHEPPGPSAGLRLLDLNAPPAAPRAPLSLVRDVVGEPPPVDEPKSVREVVHGVQCVNGHFNHQGMLYCRACGIGMVQQSAVLVEGERPSLGVIVMADGSTFSLDDEYLLGREPSGDAGVRSIVVDDRRVSRRHALLSLKGWDVIVTDLGSSNGTYLKNPGWPEWVRATPNQPMTLDPGGQIGIGGQVLVYESSARR